MNRIRATIIISVIMAIGSAGIFFLSCKKKSWEGMIIFTQVSSKRQNYNYVNGDSLRYIRQARIVALDPDIPGGSLKVLTAGFFSARSPEISCDGNSMLFSAQQKQNDPWQIWEMNFEDSEIRQITSSSENCTDPAYLPGERLVFSKLAINDTSKAGHLLYTCNRDGSDIKQITFNPHTYIASSVLKDGRVLTISRQLYPDQGEPVFMVLRPDGTKAEMFYKSAEGSALSGRGWETINGKVIFIESGKGNNEEGNVISISYNRPLHSRVNLTSEIEGDFKTVFPLQSGRLLVSYRKSDTDRYALYELDTDMKVLGKAVYNNADFDVLEAVVVEKNNRPKKLPSEVDMGVKTGLLLCQDINFSEMKSSGNAFSFPKGAKIEVIGIDSTLGVVQVEEDGSFYLKVIADTPFQIQTIDEKGRVLNGPCGWIWLRPNERRGCVGCHQDPEMVPGNRVPMSVKKPPVNIPVHIYKVVEKKVSLE
jgi:hypothetical protein